MTDTTVIKADPTARRLLWVALLIFAVAFSAALVWLPPWLRVQVTLAEQQSNLAYARIEQLLRTTMVLSVLLPALLGVLMIYVGMCIQRSGQFPYPHMRPLRDTPLVTGAPALKRARISIVTGALLLLIAPFIAWYLQGVARRLMYLLG